MYIAPVICWKLRAVPADTTHYIQFKAFNRKPQYHPNLHFKTVQFTSQEPESFLFTQGFVFTDPGACKGL